MNRKNEKNKFEFVQNIEEKSMLWYPEHLDHSDDKRIQSLIGKNLRYWFYFKTIKIILEKFDIWNAGALKIKLSHFCALFLPHIKQKRTVTNYLDHQNKLKLIYSWIEGDDLILYSPYVERVTENYVKNKKQKRIYDQEPDGAGDLIAQCKVHAPGLRL